MGQNDAPPNAITKDTFTGHFRAYLASRQNQSDEGTETARICKRAKDQGIDVDAMRQVERMRKLDPLRREALLENLCIYLDWAGVPNQLRFDLSGQMTTEPRGKAAADEPKESAAHEQGKEQGLAGTFDPPYEKGTFGFTWFYQGWLEGQKELASAKAKDADEGSDGDGETTTDGDSDEGDGDGDEDGSADYQ